MSENLDEKIQDAYLGSSTYKIIFLTRNLNLKAQILEN